MIDKNALGNSRASVGTYHKQSPVAPKKLALRDVQNDKRNYVCTQPESSYLLERGSKADTVKVCGAKRLVPDCPSSPSRRFSLSANEDPTYVARKSDLELTKRRIQETTGSRSADIHQSRQQLAQMQSQKLENNNNTSVLNPMTSRSSHLSSISEVYHSAKSQESSDQQRMERFLRLQKFLKHCDETDPKDYIQMLLYLSPTELSRHAIELEYRSIQLSIEEGKEIQRSRALNILGKSAQTNNSVRVQPNK